MQKKIEILLVRHGISISNENHHLVGWTDVDLSANGIRELSEYKKEILYPAVDRYYCSDLKRAQKTFALLFGDHAKIYRQHPGLREVHFGSWENADPTVQDVRGFYQHWLRNERVSDEESFHEFQQRVYNTILEILEECLEDGIERVGLVLHEGSIKAFLMALENIEFKEFNTLFVPNGLGYLLKVTMQSGQPVLLDKQKIAPEYWPEPFTLMLVRHGISAANEEHRMVGWTDVDLGESGEKELLSYRSRVDYPSVERFYCSDLRRAKRTYEILFQNRRRDCHYCQDLRENYFGKAEDIPSGPASRRYITQWLKQIPMDGEEGLLDFQDRIVSTVTRIVKECRKDGLHSCGIVSHSGVMKILLLTLQHRPYEDWRLLQIPNGLGFVLTVTLRHGKLTLLEQKSIKAAPDFSLASSQNRKQNSTSPLQLD